MKPHDIYQPSLAHQVNAQQTHLPEHYNRFPDHRGVFDGNQRTLWQFGGKEPRPYENPFAQDVDWAHQTPANGGHYLPKKLSVRNPHVPPEAARFHPFDHDKLQV
jgi:hypothetical protein